LTGCGTKGLVAPILQKEAAAIFSLTGTDVVEVFTYEMKKWLDTWPNNGLVVHPMNPALFMLVVGYAPVVCRVDEFDSLPPDDGFQDVPKPSLRFADLLSTGPGDWRDQIAGQPWDIFHFKPRETGDFSLQIGHIALAEIVQVCGSQP